MAPGRWKDSGVLAPDLRHQMQRSKFVRQPLAVYCLVLMGVIALGFCTRAMADSEEREWIEKPHATCEPVPIGKAPVIQCQRAPPCIRHNYFFPQGLETKCTEWKKDEDWPTWDPYVDRQPHFKTMGDIAEMLPNRTVMFIGDSLDWNMYTAAMCGLARADNLRRSNARNAEFYKATQAIKEKNTWITSYGTVHTGAVFAFMRMDHYRPEELAKYLELTDVAVVNFGLHYKPQEYEQFVSDIANLAHQLDGWQKANPGKVASIREIGAQHFWSTGAFNRSDHMHNGDLGYCDCFPMSLYTQETNFVAKQNRVIHEAILLYPNVPLFPFYHNTIPRYRMHEERYCIWNKGEGDGCCDCSHICYTPVFWDLIFTDLYHVIRAQLKGNGHLDETTGIARNVGSVAAV